MAKTLLEQLGGKDNILTVLACATSRLRLELKTDTQLNEEVLKKAGVTNVMKINDRVVHLLLGDKVEGTEQALKALLS